VTTTERPATKRKTSQPITAHRLFPAMVALWFAALFGLGSFAMSPRFLEGIVSAIGLPALVPATTPPLGFTARALVALAMTVLGGGIGLLVALRLRPRAEVAPRRRFATGKAAAHDDTAPRVRARDAHPDAPPRKPLVLTEDFAESAEDLPPVDGIPLRRRALSVTDETQPADPFDYAPVPGFTFTQPPVEVLPAEVPPVELPVVEVAQEEDVAAFEPAVEEYVEPEIALAAEPFHVAKTVAAPAPIAAVAAAIAAREPVANRSPVADAPLDSLGLVQLIERLALAIADRRKAQEAGVQPPFVAPVAEPEAELPEAMAPEPEPLPSFTPASPSVPFGIARLQSQPAPLRSPFATPIADGDADEDNTDGVIVPRFLGLARAAPIVEEADEAEARAPLPETDAVADIEPPVPEDRYPSLVDMTMPLPLRQEFARIEQPEEPEAAIEPVVIFPGQGHRPVDSRPVEPGSAPFARPAPAPAGPAGTATQQAFVPPASALPDPEEADRALRSALATLQRMTAKG